MAAARSLTPFYVALAVVAVGGGIFIASSAGRRGGTLSLADAATMPPITGPRGVVIGSDSAPVEIAEYSDFECPYCARFAILTLPDIQQRLVATGRIRWRFMHFPLDGHLKSPPAHLAAACANEQGRFWQMHDAIYASQADWVASRRPERVLRGLAERLGLDMAQFDGCVSERRQWGAVLADRRLGDSLAVTGTPTLFVNGRQLSHVPSFDQLRALVDSVGPPPPTQSPPVPQR
jgi:protein-disulfide isomerase